MWFALALYVWSVGWAALLGYAKWRGVAFHTRDYPYYYQFAAKLFDGDLADRFSLNPRGRSFLGFSGDDGAGSFHRGIHFEPLKYVNALAYAMIPSAYTLVFLQAALFYLPIFYLVWAMPRSSPSDRRFLVLLALAYAASATGVLSTVRDLRPIVQIVPALCCVLVAIYYDRPRREMLAFFVALLLVREEGLVLGACAIGIAWALDVACGRRWHNRVGALAAAWLASVAIVAAYFAWAGFEREAHRLSIGQGVEVVRSLAGGPVFWIAATGAGALAAWAWRRPKAWREALPLLAFGALAVPVFLEVYLRMKDPGLEQAFQECFARPEGALQTLLAILFAVALRAARPTRVARVLCEVYLAAAIVLFCWLNAENDRCYRERLDDWRGKIDESRVLFQWRTMWSRAETPLMTDLRAYQVFADFDRVVCFERLAAYRLPHVEGYELEDRRFPQNLPHLRRILSEETRWLAMRPESRGTLRRILEEAGEPWPFRLIERSDRYEIHVRTGPLRSESGD